jgi:branched-chain amino acid transport system substrate-binding protein
MTVQKLVVLLTTQVALAGAILDTPALAETVKIGIVNTLSGPLAPLGNEIDRGIKLYVKEHQKDLPSDVSIELVQRDDGGDSAKAIEVARELIEGVGVRILTGFVWSPAAAAAARVTQEDKIPTVLLGATDMAITKMSSFFVRVSSTIPQETYPLGTWAAKSFKTGYTLLSESERGRVADEAFTKSFKAAGGTILNSTFVPVAANDLSSYLVRLKDARPDIAFIFLPGALAATVKAWRDVGLESARVNLALTQGGTMLLDDALRKIGDDAIGVYSSGSYSAASTRPQNRAFVAAYKRDYGDQAFPSVLSVQAWDGMDAIFNVLKQTKGNFTSEQVMSLLKSWHYDDSPRGPIRIDPESRDIVENIYIRRVENVHGFLQNVEFLQFAEVMSDGTGGGGDPCPLGQCRNPDRTCSACKK